MPQSPNPSSPRESIAVARRLFGLQGSVEMSDAEMLASAERLGTCVPEALARWFGPYGSLALVSRALVIAEAEQRALSCVTVESTQSPRLAGIAASAERFGSSAMTDGIIALTAALYELLGRLIGNDLAVQLLDQCAAKARAASTDDVPHTKSDP
jgi:hypothetical protein